MTRETAERIAADKIASDLYAASKYTSSDEIVQVAYNQLWLSQAIEAALVSARADGERDGLEKAAKWHDQRVRDTPDAFEMELHQVSAAAIREMKDRP